MKETCRKIIFLFLFSCSILLSCSQTLPYERYTSKNGLISDRITTLAQDEKGFMWFGSYFGICRYDGIKFEKIILPAGQQNKFVTFLLPAGNKMYAGFLFNSGLFEYNNGKTQAYFIKGTDSAFANEFICAANGNDGSILLGNSSNQVYQFKNGTFTQLYSLQQKTQSIKFIERDKYKNLWIATTQGLLVLPFPYRSEQWYFTGDNIFSLLKDQDEKIWFCRTAGASTILETTEGWLQGKLQRETIIPTSQNIANVPFSGNTAKGFWGIGTNGLTNITGAKKEEHYKVSLDLSADINILFSDRENNIWITNKPGVVKISNFNIRSFLFHEIAADGGSICLESDSSILVSNGKNIYSITDNTIQKKSLLEGRDYYGILFVDSKKDLWINYWNGGLWHIKRDRGKIISKTYFSEFKRTRIKVQSIIEDKDNNIWVAGMNGIFRVKNDQVVENFSPPNAAGNAAFITCMALDEKNNIMWLGDNALGVIKLQYQTDSTDRTIYKIAGYVTAKNGLKDGYIRSLMLDHKNMLWVGTRSGGIYQVASNKNFTVTNYTHEANIVCTRISDIKLQDTTAVWFATCDGIFKYHYSTNEWTHYNTSDGLLNAEVFSIAVDPKNEVVWTLTSQGVTKLRLNPGEKIPAPLISITGINVLGKPDTAALSSSPVTKYSYTQNSIGFSFAGASFIDEKKIKYKYMLQGYDRQWSDPVMTNNVNYASLPPGKYVFMVIASNAKDEWSDKPATFSFEIIMPVYKRPWFIFTLIILIILIAYFIRVQQMNQRFKIEKLRLNIARDLHDDIGSTLGSINLLSKTATRRLDKNVSAEEITPVFEKIGRSAENTLEAMDDIVWSINPEKDKVEDVVIRMREFAIPLLEAKDIEFSFVVEGAKDIAIPMHLRRNAFLIFKELIHNIIKHSEAGKVVIRLQADNNRLKLQVTDNGKGFDPGAPTRRNGLKNMTSRAEMVGGNVRFATSENGTETFFEAPIR